MKEGPPNPRNCWYERELRVGYKMTEKQESTLLAADQESTLSVDSCWALLERVALSSPMKKAGRLRNLLLYVGRRSLKEGCLEIHEKEIGVEVFGRQEAYDTSVDNIVRTNVSDLRKRIGEYFRSEGLNEPIVMEIPRGAYVPIFRLRQVEPAKVAELALGPAVNSANIAEVSEAAAANNDVRSRTAARSGIIILSLACLILSLGCFSLWQHNRELEQKQAPWRSEASVLAFWSGFVDSAQETDIVLPDTTFRLLQTMTRESFTLQDYLSGSYLKDLEERHPTPEMHAAFEAVSSRDLGTKSELNLAQSILALDPTGKTLHLYHARDYLPDLLKKDNVILIGSPFGNPWDELFEKRLNFIAKDDFNSPRPSVSIVNRSPQPGEQSDYKPAGSVAYCTVAYLPNQEGNGNVLLIGGVGTGSLEAARDFLLSDTQLSNFRKSLHADKIPYFEVLIRVMVVKGTPVNETMLAHRIYPMSQR